MSDYAISYETDENLGDHGRIVTLPMVTVEGETVEELVRRAAKTHARGYTRVNQPKQMNKYDRIIIQRVVTDE